MSLTYDDSSPSARVFGTFFEIFFSTLRRPSFTGGQNSDVKFRDSEIHPILWRATDRLNSRWNMGNWSKDGEAERVNKHWSLWMKQYWAGCLACVVPFALSFPAAFLAKEWLGRGVPPLITLVLFWAIGGVMIGVGYERNKRRLSVEELENLSPLLELDPVGRAYTDTVIALGKSSLPEEVAKETLASLNRVLDESERLTEAAGTDPVDDAVPAEEERARLLALRDSATDHQARTMYDESLRLLDLRSTGRADRSARVARAEAQRELMRQTVLSVRDAVVGAREAADGQSDTADIRRLLERVADVRREADAGARAAEELRAL